MSFRVVQNQQFESRTSGVGPALSIPAAGQKDRGLWGRECYVSRSAGDLAHAQTFFSHVQGDDRETILHVTMKCKLNL